MPSRTSCLCVRLHLLASPISVWPHWGPNFQHMSTYLNTQTYPSHSTVPPHKAHVSFYPQYTSLLAVVMTMNLEKRSPGGALRSLLGTYEHRQLLPAPPLAVSPFSWCRQDCVEEESEEGARETWHLPTEDGVVTMLCLGWVHIAPGLMTKADWPGNMVLFYII